MKRDYSAPNLKKVSIMVLNNTIFFRIVKKKIYLINLQLYQKKIKQNLYLLLLLLLIDNVLLKNITNKNMKRN
jgi:hypothetical protein